MNEMMQRMQFWCQKVLPLVYDDSLSYYELLCKVVDYLNRVIDNENDLNKTVLQNIKDIEQLKLDIKFLQDEMNKVKNGDYVSLYLDSIIKWIDENLTELVARIAKFVFFELDDCGYFNAIIPSNWECIDFSTTEKGELVLKY